MRLVKACLTIALVFALASFAVAQQDPTTEKMIDEVVQKTKDITSYRVDMKTEMQMMGQMTVSNGEMAYKKPDKMHMTTTTEMMGGVQQEIFSSGDIVWTYMPMMNMATKLDMSKIKGQMPQYSGGVGESGDITNPFKGLPGGKIKYLGKKTDEGKEVLAFEAAMPAQGQMPPGQGAPQQMMPKKIEIMMDAGSGLPHKIIAYGENNVLMMQQTYSNFRTNISIDDSEFAFTPPEGVQIMDMTQGAMNMMKQMQGSQPATK
jgi:outer membrane lipoprotein-sorting protein